MEYSFVTNSSIINQKDWIIFVREHPNGNIFHTPEMVELYESTEKHEPLVIACYDKAKQIVGILVAVIQKEYSGFLGKLTARATVWGGPLVKNNDICVLEAIMKEYDQIIKKQAIYTQIRNLFGMEWAKNSLEKIGYKCEDHLDILIALDKPVDVLWKELHPTRRKQIDRGYRRGVDFYFDQKPDEIVLSECFELIASLYKRIKLPFPNKDFFLNSYLNFNERIGLFILKYQGKIIGCRFVLLYKKMIYDWYAGSEDESLDKYPNDILPWEVMKWGAENGYKVFDFGGAGKPGILYGVRDFKLKFGGELVNFGRFQKRHQPFTMSVAKLGFRFWQLLRK